MSTFDEPSSNIISSEVCAAFKKQITLLTTDPDSIPIALAAGFVTNSQAQIYYPGQSTQTMQELVQEALAASTFQTDLELTDRDRYLILSTCSYEFEEARYVVIGRLEALG